MARMSIDDKFLRDPRVTRLAELVGWSRRETMGCLLEVFALAYDMEADVLPDQDIEAVAKLAKGTFVASFLASGMGERPKVGFAKVRIRGAKDRIKYLQTRAKSGREGGLKSGESRRKSSKHTFKHTSEKIEAPLNPPDVPISSVPDPVPDVPTAQGIVGVNAIALTSPTPRQKRTPKPLEYTPQELADVGLVLQALSKRNGVAYTGSEHHTRLIVARLRSGLSQLDLRAVSAYCADMWSEDPKMRTYLRPETLFGPETIGRYLDPARTAYRSELARMRAQETTAAPQLSHPLLQVVS